MHFKIPVIIKCFILTIMIVLGICLIVLLKIYNIIPSKSYTAEELGIEHIKSKKDFNNNGIDDYTDIVIGARNYVKTRPKYDGTYYDGGYPPNGIGVCTDVIWKGFENAGYNLKELVDNDIKNNIKQYYTISLPDPNIDFRRVKNLKIFFSRNALSLTTDANKVSDWQPGDIVIYSDHIAIVSDKRTRNGTPFIIHNGGQPIYEENALTRQKIVAHYRWI